MVCSVGPRLAGKFVSRARLQLSGRGFLVGPFRAGGSPSLAIVSSSRLRGPKDGVAASAHLDGLV